MKEDEWTINFELSSIDKRERTTNSSSFLVTTISFNLTARHMMMWMNERESVYICIYIHICAFYVSLVVLDLDQATRGKSKKKKKKKRKQSFQSNKFKLLSMVNRSSFVIFKKKWKYKYFFTSFYFEQWQCFIHKS